MAEDQIDDVLFPVPARLLDPAQCPEPYISSMKQYREMYRQSIEEPDQFFGKLATELLTWFKPFHTVRHGGLKYGDTAWFLDGQLNASYNCVDRHALTTPDKVAIIYDADEPNQVEHITYGQLLRQVSQLAGALRARGIRKGDTVAIYMPMIPEAVIALLACTRIGALHSVVFAGFSSEALRDRVLDAKSRLVLTADQGKRGGKTVDTKKIVDEALKACPSVETVIVSQRTGADVPMKAGRDYWWGDEVSRQPSYIPAEMMNSEDPMFLLYTSGSTGKPKGVMHTTAGYLLGAIATVKYVFDYHPGDIFACMADVGWITGHTYIVYGPLALGATTVLFESIPTYPTPSRYWELIAKHKVTQFYTAPTAIRALRRLGDEWVEGHNLSSLRVLGTVGEPINPEAWHWYNEKIGKGRCAIVDTYWQTETGSHVITPLPGAIPTKAGSATLPFFGIDLAILDPASGKELIGNDVTGVLAIKRAWPSIARTIYGDHQRFLETYLRPYPGYYFTGDGATRDKDGYIWICGRVDDVINVSGHRLSTAEIESALIMHHAVAETAVIGADDEVTGQCIHAFVCLKPGLNHHAGGLGKELMMQVRKVIGPFAAPKRIYLVEDLPKTRSGKLMRRVLRKIVAGETDSLGDISTLADPTIVDILIARVARA
ncbi:acetyl-coenzyme A synthetase [Gamsiella multidivaricata]|uniref:acetyl-coenzyme A synthetase n=1 Tax=Gamsiella multidivaricata TaxID=101098 RepID=UPI00222116BF|nr:acetyl-coenzyme A synthetase [Gamsiella multidivaricata]KAG0370268.1 acetyl-CoA synthetase [Gamsiella multidivaricata]KAI7825355.1 acetyl-coenzyme A synthetase [Gamsiella multidivaricata]